MARTSNLDPGKLISLIQARGPVSAMELASLLGVSRSTVIRALTLLGGDLVALGATRNLRYRLRREVRGIGNRWPVYRIDETGRARTWGTLEAMHDRAWRMTWDGTSPEWAGHFTDAAGMWEGFPFFLADLRLRGFVGRAVARRLSEWLRVPANPEEWSDEDTLVFLYRAGDEMPGDCIVGDFWFQNHLSRISCHSPFRLAHEDRRAERYPALAIQAADDPVGSSAGGEQPKFLTTLHDGQGKEREVMVKFSAPMDQPVAIRWADLLLAEYHAHEVLAGWGFGTPGARLLDAGGRRFLEMPRFDRSGAHGRRGVVSLAALYDAAIAGARRDWTTAMLELQGAGLVDVEAVSTTRRLQAFGDLIGNTDMHFGNLSFWSEDTLPFQVAPAYDMLPMLWRPSEQGEIPDRRFNPPAPLPAAMDAWGEAVVHAQIFWERLIADERLSGPFAVIARGALEGVARMRKRFG